MHSSAEPVIVCCTIVACLYNSECQLLLGRVRLSVIDQLYCIAAARQHYQLWRDNTVRVGIVRLLSTQLAIRFRLRYIRGV